MKLFLRNYRFKLTDLFMVVTVLLLFISIEKACVLSNVLDSDSVENVIWAQATMDSGELVSKTFFYPYFIPVGGNVLMIPFIKIFGFGLLANRIGMTFLFMIMTGQIIHLGSYIFDEKKKLCIFVICSLLMFRTQIGHNLLRHILYYQIGFICFLGCLIILAKYFKNEKFSFVDCIALILFGLFAGINGVPTVALSIGPVCLSMIISKFLKGRYSKQDYVVVGSLIIGTMAGLALFKAFSEGGITTNYLNANGSYIFLDSEEWFENLEYLFRDWLRMFFMVPSQGIKAFSLECIELLLECALAIISLVFPIIFVIKYRYKFNHNLCVICFSVLFVWTVCIAEYVLMRGRLDRLISNALFATMILFAISFATMYSENKTMLLIFNSTVIFMSIILIFRSNVEVNTEMTDELRTNELYYGYADYWDANVNTVLSGGEVTIRSLYTTPEGELWTAFYGTDRRWFHKPEQQFFFVVITQDDYDLIMDKNRELFDYACNLYPVCDKAVYVFRSEDWDKVITGECK